VPARAPIGMAGGPRCKGFASPGNRGLWYADTTTHIQAHVCTDPFTPPTKAGHTAPQQRHTSARLTISHWPQHQNHWPQHPNHSKTNQNPHKDRNHVMPSLSSTPPPSSRTHPGSCQSHTPQGGQVLFPPKTALNQETPFVLSTPPPSRPFHPFTFCHDLQPPCRDPPPPTPYIVTWCTTTPCKATP
jgi:hypothetical protein